MENNRAFESMVGFAVIVVAILFSVYAFNYSKLKTESGYPLFAKFDRIDGIKEGSEVRLGGIKIGRVVKIELDGDEYVAKVWFRINDNIKLPTDTAVAVNSDGLLGGKHIYINPGADDEYLKPEDEVLHTQGSINLESLIGKFVVSDDKSDKK